MPTHRVNFSASHSVQRTCLNGHIISNWAETESEQMWCHKCGARTISACPACDGPLKGGRKNLPQQPSKPDAYCMHCGKALPWTEARLEAIRDAAKYVDGLNDEDRKILSEILPDLASTEPTPRTELAIVKMKSLFKKGGSTFVDATRKLLVDVVSDALKRRLFH